VHGGATNGGSTAANGISGTSEAQRLRETCHDMRQALAGVFALAGAALTEPGLPQNARDRLEQIVGQAQWLADMLQESLHADEHVSRVLDLTSLASEAVESELVTYAGRLDLAWPDAPVLTRGSRVTIRRMIANLLSNATRAAGPLGHVRVETAYEQDQALLLIDDSGPGFGRIAEGSGLGLHSVARGMDGSSGRLEYADGDLGGVQARMWLPLPEGWAEVTRGLTHVT
jgi:signal transduction histidine kinase